MPTLIPHVPIIGQLAEPLANVLGLKALPLNLHEIIIGFIFYEFVFLLAAPWISKCLVGAKYKALSAKDKLRWDAQCVSLVRTYIRSAPALCIIFLRRYCHINIYTSQILRKQAPVLYVHNHELTSHL